MMPHASGNLVAADLSVLGAHTARGKHGVAHRVQPQTLLQAISNLEEANSSVPPQWLLFAAAGHSAELKGSEDWQASDICLQQ